MNSEAQIGGRKIAKEKRREIYALVSVCIGVGLVTASLLSQARGEFAKIMMAVGCGLVGGGFARVLVGNRSVARKD